MWICSNSYLRWPTGRPVSSWVSVGWIAALSDSMMIIADSIRTITMITTARCCSPRLIFSFLSLSASCRWEWFFVFVRIMQLVYADLHYAYQRARRGKSKKKEIIAREADLEKNMQQLYKDICAWNYQIGTTKRYIVADPVVREIVALSFRDRIVQHLVSHYLMPLFESQWIHDSYANRVGKGTLFGIRRVDKFMRSCSRNYTVDARVLKLDIQSCFMSISRTLVRQLVTRRLFACRVGRSKEIILSLVHKILFHDYVTWREDHTIASLRKILPVHKSMLACPPNTWLPLGNLTSHLFSNIILHELDLFIKHELHIHYYGRYVDDFVCMHADQGYLKSCIAKIEYFLSTQLGLHIHPRKIYFQHFTKWVPFLWVVIKPYCRLIGRKTIRALQKLPSLIPPRISLADGVHIGQSINSYFGLVRHHDSFCLRKSLISALPPNRYNYLRVRPGYSSVKPRVREVQNTQNLLQKN